MNRSTICRGVGLEQKRGGRHRVRSAFDRRSVAFAGMAAELYRRGRKNDHLVAQRKDAVAPRASRIRAARGKQEAPVIRTKGERYGPAPCSQIACPLCCPRHIL